MDVGDRQEVKKRKTKAQLQRERESAELKELLNKKQMRNFLWRLLTECGVYQTAISHPQEIYRFEGRRDIGLWTLKEIDAADKEAYGIMRRENDV